MEDQCVSEIEHDGLKDPDLRARCVDLIILLRKLKKSLEFYIEDGEMSKKRLDELLEVKSQKINFGGLFG